MSATVLPSQAYEKSGPAALNLLIKQKSFSFSWNQFYHKYHANVRLFVISQKEYYNVNFCNDGVNLVYCLILKFFLKIS